MLSANKLKLNTTNFDEEKNKTFRPSDILSN